MHTIKQEALIAIAKPPDSATIDDIMYRPYVIDKINRSQEAIKNGKVLTPDELKREVLTWKTGQNH